MQKYYRVTNLSLSPYMENGVYTEYQFSKDQNFHLWPGIEYKEITKEEYKMESHKVIEWENEIAREMARELAK
jgi:hypothetical protein